MRHYEHRLQRLAIGLAMLAGFVDALGYLRLRGMFVSFMSGNSTRMAVGTLASDQRGLVAGGLIASFVAGVMVGTGVGARAGKWRKLVVLGTVTGALAMAAIADLVARKSLVATLLMAGAMGAANAVFQRDGEVSVGVTYMTGTLVKFGQHLMLALMGGPRLAWLPYLSLWLGLVGGAVAGAWAYPLLGLQALWIAVMLVAVMISLTYAAGQAKQRSTLS